MNKGCLGLIALFICFSISFSVLGFTVNYIGGSAFLLCIGGGLLLAKLITPWFNSITKYEETKDNNFEKNNFYDNDYEEYEYNEIEDDKDDENDEDDEFCIPLNKDYKIDKDNISDDEDGIYIPLRKE